MSVCWGVGPCYHGDYTFVLGLLIYCHLTQPEGWALREQNCACLCHHHLPTSGRESGEQLGVEECMPALLPLSRQQAPLAFTVSPASPSFTSLHFLCLLQNQLESV